MGLAFPTTSTDSVLQLKEFKRAPDGSGNNLKHKEYCSSETGLMRMSPPVYADGSSEPVETIFNPREASNFLGRVQYPLNLNKNNVTMAFTIWGQFLDHDITLT